ncbi:MAG: glycosyl hydrolase 53 family protein [Planctomycetaceae bacterium]|nr:glycosyl hydrolase 53 family protein [Planctomycetaceae bacterium]
MQKYVSILLWAGIVLTARAGFLANGDFNAGDSSGWWKWSPDPAAQSISIETSHAYDGTACVKMVSATDGSWQNLGQSFGCTENTAYVLSFVYDAPQWAKAGIGLVYYDSGGTSLGYKWYTLANTAGWKSWDVGFRTPAAAAYAEVRFDEGGWGTMYVDRVDVSVNIGRKGADVSSVVRQEAQGVRYHEDGIRKDPLVILKNHGITLASIRLFVNPGMSDEGASMDLPYVTSLAARCRNAGMQILLSLHYSDTWTNPGTQSKPAAWEGLTHEQLVTQVYNYTYDVVSAIQPEYTKIGNETNCGMLWPQGNLCDGNWANFRAYVNAGHNAAKAACPGTITLVHISPSSEAMVQWYFDNLLAGSISFDRIALSLYPEFNGDLANMTASHEQAAKYGKRVMIVEMADHYAGVAGKSEATQKQFVKDMLALNPDAIYWEPLCFRGAIGYRSLFKQLYPGSNDWHNCEMTEGLAGFGYPYGDFTEDGVIDIRDLAAFAQWWLLDGCNQTAGKDLDDNCRINLYELSVFAQNWL